MRFRLACLSILVTCLLVVTATGQAPQAPSAGDSPFTGRWELVMQVPAGTTNPFEGDGIPFMIIDIKGTGASPSGTIVDTMGSGISGIKLTEVAVRQEQLVLVLDAGIGTGSKMTVQLKRVGDRLEGTATAEGQKEVPTFVGRITTADKLAVPKMRAPAADQKAFTTAMLKPPAQRTEALKQFLKDYPDFAQKERALLELAKSYQDRAERVAALNKFIEDFPKSTQVDQARLQIALVPAARADRAVALKKLIDEMPAGAGKEAAEFELINNTPAGNERLAAQEAFVEAHPKSAYTSSIQRTLLDTYMRTVRQDETKLNATIDGFLGASPDRSMTVSGASMNLRASALNTVADRLMVNDVMLDRALALIQEAIKVAGDKEAAQSRSMYVTTLGQVLYKLKRYDESEAELKRAIDIGKGEGSGEAQLFLGKVYEVKKNDDGALQAYFDAATLASSQDIKTSLERTWTKKNGSLAGLEDKLDAIYKARPKPFEAGHFTRPAAGGKTPPRVVLAELFTGAECGPCVASDLAFDGVAERFDRAAVTVLEYHLHIPGPDPMTNADTEERAKYYTVGGTPTSVIDGGEPQAGGGGTAQATQRFNDFKGKIETRLGVAPQALLTGFQAKVNGQTITVTGQADLAPAAADKVKKPVLHVALVQDVVRYTGANGVRFHSFVVRKLVGGAAGTPLQTAGTRTKISEKIDVAALSADQDKYLTKYEADRSKGREAFTFTDKVARVDPRQLLVVAFVQDDQTKEILQSVFVVPGR